MLFPGKTSIHGEVHEKKAGNLDLLLECVTFHLQSVFHPNAAEAVKFYITNTLKKPSRVPIWQFFVQVEQLKLAKPVPEPDGELSN